MPTEITLQELETRIRERAGLALVEALPPRHFAAGHLPAAINLPLESLPEAAARLLPDRDAEIVVYCSGPSCQNSHTAARTLETLGYQQVRVFAGGKAEWTAAGNPLETAGPAEAVSP